MKQLKSNAYTLVKLGNEILKHKAIAVDNILSTECQQLIETMMTAVDEAGGVGIAAPQIQHGVRIFIMCSKPNRRYPDAPLMTPTAIINPEILHHSTKKVKGWEGCLSVPKLRGFVPRYEHISVKYFDRQGQVQHREFDGFIARIFQHELDHLNGLTFIDRLESNQDLISEEQWYQSFINMA